MAVGMEFWWYVNTVIIGFDCIAELIESVSERATIDIASDTDGDDGGCAPKPVWWYLHGAIAVVDNIAYVPR